MATRRMISADTFEDEFFLNLDMLGRNLWFGLIIRCADDQGRLQDNSILIKSQVFPADDISPEQVEAALVAFTDAGRVHRYTAKGKKVIQIVNWWRHQAPSWASPSKYDPPDSWIDREKYHTTGNKIVTRNWDIQGGFQTLPSPLPSTLPSTLPTGIDEIKSEVKSEGEVNGETPPPSTDPDFTPDPADDIEISQYAPYERVFHEETGLHPLTSHPQRNYQACKELAEAGATPEDLRQAIREQNASAKKNGRNYSGISIASYVTATLNVLVRRRAKPPGPTVDPALAAASKALYGGVT